MAGIRIFPRHILALTVARIANSFLRKWEEVYKKDTLNVAIYANDTFVNWDIYVDKEDVWRAADYGNYENAGYKTY